jgi:hypothetical protein
MNLELKQFFVDIVQYFQYGVLKTDYNFPIPKSIHFESTPDKKNGTVLIASVDYPGLYTIVSQNNDEETIDSVNDAIFTYFEVPRYIANRTENLFFPDSLPTEGKIKFTYPKGIATA